MRPYEPARYTTVSARLYAAGDPVVARVVVDDRAAGAGADSRAAVNLVDRAGHIAGRVRGEEQHQVGDLLGQSRPGERQLRDAARQRLRHRGWQRFRLRV